MHSSGSGQQLTEQKPSNRSAKMTGPLPGTMQPLPELELFNHPFKRNGPAPPESSRQGRNNRSPPFQRGVSRPQFIPTPAGVEQF